MSPRIAKVGIENRILDGEPRGAEAALEVLEHPRSHASVR